MDHILTLGKGKDKRQWNLTDEEFDRFESMFEESELIDCSNLNISDMKLTLTPPPEVITL